MYKVLKTIRHPETLAVILKAGEHVTHARFETLQREYGITWDAVDGPD